MFVIEIRNLQKTYGAGEISVQALRGVDLAVSKGEFVAIMGPSGSGKSTLLHMLGGVDTPTEGSVLLEGTDLGQLDDDRRTLIRRDRLGFVFQSFNLLPAFTAEENVALPLDLAGVPSAESRRRAVATLDLVGMGHRRDHVPGTLSGGEQQRVAIARALVMRPALLLADEPTGNLDTKNSSQITALMRKLVDEDEQTIVMVTHDEGVAALADRIVRLRDGLIDREESVVHEDVPMPAGPNPCLRVVKPVVWTADPVRRTLSPEVRYEKVMAALSEEFTDGSKVMPRAAVPDDPRPLPGLAPSSGKPDAHKPSVQPTCMFKRRP